MEWTSKYIIFLPVKSNLEFGFWLKLSFSIFAAIDIIVWWGSRLPRPPLILCGFILIYRSAVLSKGMVSPASSCLPNLATFRIWPLLEFGHFWLYLLSQIQFFIRYIEKRHQKVQHTKQEYAPVWGRA